jgi:hypothetical protein
MQLDKWKQFKQGFRVLDLNPCTERKTVMSTILVLHSKSSFRYLYGMMLLTSRHLNTKLCNVFAGLYL